jgi:hypothetical protein
VSGLIATAALGLTGLARAETITLDVVHAWPGHNSFHEQVAEAFTKAHPDIQIKFRASPPSYDEGHQALLRGIMTNQLPDIYYSGFHLLPEVVAALKKRDHAVDLRPFMNTEGADWLKSNYESSVLGLGQVKGVQYGLAFNASTPVIFYNGDLVKQAGGNPEKLPGDWNSLIELAAKIGKMGNGINGMAYDIHAWPDDWLWRALVMEQGEPIMNADGKTVAFGGTAGLKALELARRFVTDGTMSLRDFDQSRQQFAAGKIGFIFSSPNGARAFSDLVGTVDAAQAMEIYNHGCQLVHDKGDGAYLLDGLLDRGHRLLATAVDDAHFKAPDFGGAWLELKAPSREPEAIVSALKSGHFYATQGPQIHSLAFDEESIDIECTSAAGVLVVGCGYLMSYKYATSLTRARLPLTLVEKSPWFRVIVIGADGRRAWSNPVWKDAVRS